jgi:prevent-host-death family protein
MGRRKHVGARELKTRLGTYLRQVRRGATLVVTERGEPVAELRPLPVGATELHQRLEELAGLGVLARETGGPLSAFVPIARGAALSDAILEDREDRS